MNKNFSVSTALWTLTVKEIRRFLRIWVQTLVPPAVTMSLYFVIFGSLIGPRIGSMDGFDYIQFMIPGLIMLSVITNSYNNVVSSFYSVKFQKSIEELLISPMPNWVILLGFVLGGVARGVFIGFIVFCVSLIFYPEFTVVNPALTILVLFLTAVLFSLMGFINAVFADSFDDISIIPTNLDDSVIIGTRDIKMALRRLRKFARQGNDLELDMDNTIKSTAKNAGFLDIHMVPERSNTVKVIVLFDVGGSMDPYIKLCEELFSAIKTEFKHLEYYYFHNCIYESIWKDNNRRSQERFLVQDLINKFSSDYKIIVVGDATMAPYEITNAGGSIEHWNDEPGHVWIKRLADHFDNLAWLNPVPDDHWDYTSSICIMKDLFEDRMYPLTLKGLEEGMSNLSK
jgi:hypothetical protein